MPTWISAGGHHARAMERRYAAAVTSGSMAIPVRPTFAHVPAVYIQEFIMPFYFVSGDSSLCCIGDHLTTQGASIDTLRDQRASACVGNMYVCVAFAGNNVG